MGSSPTWADLAARRGPGSGGSPPCGRAVKRSVIFTCSLASIGCLAGSGWGYALVAVC